MVAHGPGDVFGGSLRFGSLFIMIMPRSLVTQSDAISSPPETSSESPRMPPWIIPLMHSYSKDMAGVVCMILVRGGRSFLTRRGSRGVRVANYRHVRISCFT